MLRLYTMNMGETIVPMEYCDINSQWNESLVVENSEGYYGAIDLEGNLEVPCPL